MQALLHSSPGWLASAEQLDLQYLVAGTPGAALLNEKLCNLVGGLLQKAQSLHAVHVPCQLLAKEF